MSSTKNKGVNELMKQITKEILDVEFSIVLSDVAQLIKNWKEEIQKIMEKKSLNHPILEMSEFDQWIQDHLQMSQSPSSLNQIRNQLHNFGYIIDFSATFDLIILNPQWLMNAFKSIFSFK